MAQRLRALWCLFQVPALIFRGLCLKLGGYHGRGYLQYYTSAKECETIQRFTVNYWLKWTARLQNGFVVKRVVVFVVVVVVVIIHNKKQGGDEEGREGGVRVLGGSPKETERETNWKNNRGTGALLPFQLR
ncbi:hypothetical protein EYF80_014609 [Liparis tanakae]|uniref:Uncharacterized protein n=1 Tax=Liparis tanakae TaxID=230148 RepID=A0A4Z2IAV6_9TELE|nr:hypothetical protein EYF80_014609 [Liparis tanakae]